MRFKLVPEPPTELERVREAQRAVPLVPGDEDDCCARLARRCGFPSRDVARTWLTFLRALELAEETPSGYRRTDADPTPEHLRRAVLDRVLLAPAALAVLAGSDEPRDVDAVFGDLRDDVPTYEHHKNPDTWEAIWRDRTADLLGWFVLVGLAERTDGGFVATDRGRDALDGC